MPLQCDCEIPGIRVNRTHCEFVVHALASHRTQRNASFRNGTGCTRAIVDFAHRFHRRDHEIRNSKNVRMNVTMDNEEQCARPTRARWNN